MNKDRFLFITTIWFALAWFLMILILSKTIDFGAGLLIIASVGTGAFLGMVAVVAFKMFVFGKGEACKEER